MKHVSKQADSVLSGASISKPAVYAPENRAF